MTESLLVHLATPENGTSANQLAQGILRRSDQEVIAGLAKTPFVMQSEVIQVTDEDKAAALEIIKGSKLKKSLVPATDESKLGKFADCPANDAIITSVARFKKYTDADRQMNLPSEANELLRLALANKIPAHKFSSHDVRGKDIPANLTDTELQYYNETRNAVIGLVKSIMRQAKSEAQRLAK